MTMMVVLMVSVGVILVHCLCVVASLSRKKWAGHLARFAALSASIALLAGGALGMLLAFPHAHILLATGAAGSFVFERRRSLC